MRALPVWLIVAAALLLSSGVALTAVGALLPRLRAWQVMDVPNARSMHTKVTPRGGGLGVLLTVLPGWLLVWWFEGSLYPNVVVVLAMLMLAAVCWIDDVGGTGPALRFGVQIVAVTMGLATFGWDAAVFGGYLPTWADRVLAALCWVWFINLFNFMDGMDGLAATETIAVSAGVVILASTVLGAAGLTLEAVILAGAALGFLWWNWSPAKVFMGDVGSAPIGFLLGLLLIELASLGHLAAALILPMYFVADATWTLFRRLARGAKVWEAHREHAYQRAAQAGMSHRRVVVAAGAVNVALVGLALMSVDRPVVALALAVALVAGLLRYFLNASGGRRD